jgi:hypothetical protein
MINLEEIYCGAEKYALYFYVYWQGVKCFNNKFIEMNALLKHDSMD